MWSKNGVERESEARRLWWPRRLASFSPKKSFLSHSRHSEPIAVRLSVSFDDVSCEQLFLKSIELNGGDLQLTGKKVHEHWRPHSSHLGGHYNMG